MIEQNVVWVLTVWLVSLLMGIFSWPAARLFFGTLSDKGYSLAKVIGWIAVAYALLVTCTLRILPLSLATLLFVTGLWFGINVVLQRKYYKRESFRLLPWGQVVFSEVLFLLLLSFWAFVKGHQPEIYQIERFMDFGFIQALFNTNHLPLFDIWMQGKSLNYYYFGHLIAYVIISLTRVPIAAGFFLVEAWLFGILGVNLFRFGKDFFRYVSPIVKKPAAILAGLLSVFGVLFAGTWHSTAWFISALQAQAAGSPFPSFWYAEPTRIIPGTITEIPIYTFLVADLHAHMWGLLTGLVILIILFVIWKEEVEVKLEKPIYFLLGFILGIAYITNSWDALTLGILSGALILGRFYRKINRNLFLLFAEIGAIVMLTALPWSLFFQPPLAGLGIVAKQSPPLLWLAFWGALVIPAMVLFVKIVLRERKLLPERLGLPVIIIVCALLFLIFLEIFYFRDILKDGGWFRANTVFKIGMQVWLWLGAVCGPMLVWLISTSKTKLEKMVWLLLVTALVFSQTIYPIKAVTQANLENRDFTGLETGLSWWQQKFPADFTAYQYLKGIRDSLPPSDRVRVIVEADGDSYSDTSRFSTFLGWPTISGWAVHEWTWRGSYDEVGARAAEVREIYTGSDLQKAREILTKYQADYLVVGEVEKNKYKEGVAFGKLAKLGKVVFEDDGTLVYQINH